MGAAASIDGAAPTLDVVIAKATANLAAYPDNRCAKYLLELHAEGKFTDGSLSEEDLGKLFKCARTGLDNVESGLGCYAMEPADYDKFSFFFDRVRRSLSTHERARKRS